MNPSILSLVGLVLSIIIGILTKVNIGLLSIGMSFIVCLLVKIDPKTIVASWPNSLFMMLFGMSLLFGIASANGTLKKLVEKSTNALKGHIRFMPLLLFSITALLAALGPGNIAVVAMIMPLALSIAKAENISFLLITTMVILGANAGGLSPIAPTGIIVNNLAKQDNLFVAGTLFRDMFIVGIFFGIVTYVLMSGYKIPYKPVIMKDVTKPFTKEQKITITVTLVAIIAIMFGSNIALTAFLASGCLLLLGVSTEKEALNQVPWSAILLVCGVALMVGVVEKTQGIDVLTHTLGKLANKHTVAPIMAFIAGLMALVSSASGVVLPTLIPTVKGIAAEIGGTVKPEALISVISIGAHLVTVCPFATLGALAIASAGDGKEKDILFQQLIRLALIYLLIGALVSYFIIMLY